MKQFPILTAENTGDAVPPGHVRVGGCQMNIALGRTNDNRARCLDAMEQAAGEGVGLLVFPECALTGYAFPDAEAAKNNAVRGEADLAPLVEACERLNLAVIVGYLEVENSLLLNAATVLDGRGVLMRYHKTHLPHLGADRWVCAGTGPLRPVSVAGVNTGVLICYDGSFPEASRALTLNGAELIALPTNWPAQAIHKAAWLPNTRAYENVVYYMALNRVGEESGFIFPGSSRLCSPKGLTLVEGPADSEALIVADVNPEEARTKKIVRGDDYWVDRIADRRPDLYPREGSA